VNAEEKCQDWKLLISSRHKPPVRSARSVTRVSRSVWAAHGNKLASKMRFRSAQLVLLKEKPRRPFLTSSGAWKSKNLESSTGCGLAPAVSSASGQVHYSGAHATISAPAFRCGRRRLVSRAHGSLWRFVAKAQPFARFALFRKLRSRHRRPCRAPASRPGDDS